MGRFDLYNIDLSGMTDRVAQHNFHLDNSYFELCDGGELRKGNVDLTVDVERLTADSFRLAFHTSGYVIVTCDRCLDEMEQPIHSDDTLMVKFGDNYADDGDNVVIIPAREGEINIAWFALEFITLAIPMRHVHPPGHCDREMAARLDALVTNRDDDLPGESADD